MEKIDFAGGVTMVFFGTQWGRVSDLIIDGGSAAPTVETCAKDGGNEPRPDIARAVRRRLTI